MLPKRGGELSARSPEMKKVVSYLSVAIVVSAFATMQALGNAMADRNFSLAQELVPVNGKAFANAGLAQFALEQEHAEKAPEASETVKALALRGFSLEPAASTRAVSMLAAVEASRGRADQSRKLIGHITAITRREPVANLLYSQALVEEGSEAEALRFFDIAMRTSPSGANIILPRMVALVADAEAIPTIANLLAREPPWHDSFWYLLFRTKGVSGNIAKLRIELARNPSYIRDRAVDSAIYRSLIANGEPDTALDLYKIIGDRNRIESINDLGTVEGAPTSPFEWNWFSTGEAGAAANSGGGIDISALPQTPRTKIAEKMLNLNVGSHALLINPASSGLNGFEVDARLSCASLSVPEQRRQLAQFRVSASLDDQKFDVPSEDCPLQWIELFVSSDDRADANGMTISQLVLE